MFSIFDTVNARPPPFDASKVCGCTVPCSHRNFNWINSDWVNYCLKDFPFRSYSSSKSFYNKRRKTEKETVRSGSGLPKQDLSVAGNSSVLTVAATLPCEYDGCKGKTAIDSAFCATHTGRTPCKFPGCYRPSRPRAFRCAAHGGSRICQFESCSKTARHGTQFCVGHGGGRRCKFESCSRGAVQFGESLYCIAHGGGRRCEFENCNKSAQGSYSFCISHGGGRRCAADGCSRVVKRTSVLFCMKHSYAEG